MNPHGSYLPVVAKTTVSANYTTPSVPRIREREVYQTDPLPNPLMIKLHPIVGVCQVLFVVITILMV